MTAPACDEDEFIRVWRENDGNIERTAKAIGTTLRGVHRRRRNIEAKRCIALHSSKHEHIGNDTGSAVVTYKIQDGTILIGSDGHLWPGRLSTMQRAFLHFAKKLNPKAILDAGDSFDGPTISRHPSIGWEAAPKVHQEIDALKEFKGELEKLVPGAFRAWTLGNHDLRYESRLAQVAPEYAKVFGVHLKDHFPLWTPCWRIDINDDIVVRHREGSGEHADYRNVVNAGKTILTGHDHRTGVVPYRNYRGLHYGVRSGYMAESALDPQFVHYLEAKCPNWHPAFVVFTFVRGLLLMPELVTKVDDSHVQFRGEVIEV